jgi:hypothetical protein
LTIREEVTKSYGTHLDDERLERYSMGALPDVEIELLEDHLLACHQCQEAVISDYRMRRMIELGRSDPSVQARLANTGRFELTSRKDNEMAEAQQIKITSDLPATEHWLARYVNALLSAHRAAPSGLDFATAENLLKTERQRFDADMETALRMFHLYPHLFQSGGANAGHPASA